MVLKQRKSKMSVKGVIALIFIGCIVENRAFLVHGDGSQAQATTIGPLGKDATFSLLVQEVLDLKAQVKSQEQEIQSLESLHTYANNLTGLQAITRRLDNVTQSIRYLTLSQQFHELEDRENNRTIYQEIDQINAKIQDLLLKEGLGPQRTGK